MSRLVKPGRTVTTVISRGEMIQAGAPAMIGEGEAHAGEAEVKTEETVVQREPADTYLERVAKYVPAEIVAFFLFANNLLKQTVTDTPAGTPAKMADFNVISIGVALLVL